MSDAGGPARRISNRNADRLLAQYTALAETVGASVVGLTGIRLLSALKRDVDGAGPYPNVTLFEAANRIMTDLVMLHGVCWLLKHEVFPFREYTVEYGPGNQGAYDIEATEGGKVLIGEVFNVSPSLFPLKKAAALKKLRTSKSRPDYRVMLVNHDAVVASYAPKLRAGEHVVFVNIGTGDCRLVAGSQVPGCRSLSPRTRRKSVRGGSARGSHRETVRRNSSDTRRPPRQR